MRVGSNGWSRSNRRLNRTKCWVFVPPHFRRFLVRTPTNTQRALSFSVPCWDCRLRRPHVADECVDSQSPLGNNPEDIVLPLPDRLMRDTKKVSNLDLREPSINTGEAKMIAKCPGNGRGTLLHSPVSRYQRKMCDNCPTTNIQQGARWLLPATALPPPCSQRAALRSR